MSQRAWIGFALINTVACASIPEPSLDPDPAQDCEARLVFDDKDADGFGDLATGVRTTDCELGQRVLDASDCDDGQALVHPGADELCNDRDDDCDGVRDEEPADGREFFVDGDGDGFGADDPVIACSAPPGFPAEVDGDCDDADPTIYPGAEDFVCDGIDHDCDLDPELPVTIEGQPGGFISIQDALDAVPMNGQVNVCPGLYPESLIVPRGLVLSGLTGNPADVTIEPERGRAMTAIAPSGSTWSLTLRGLTLQGGDATSGADADDSDGGNLTAEYLSRLTLERVSVLDGTALRGGGGGIHTFRVGELTLRNVTVRGNTGHSRAGGVYNWQGPSIQLIEDSRFEHNTGGALYSSTGATTIRRSTFDGNSASSGSGIEMFGGARVLIEDTTFTNNVTSFGGAISTRVGGVIALKDTHFESNISSDCAGSAATLDGSSVELERVTVLDHTCSTRTREPSAMNLYGSSRVTVQSSTFSTNSYGLRIDSPGASISGSTFEDTSDTAVIATSDLKMTDGSIVRNQAGVQTDFTLQLDGVDLGSGASANEAFDVQTAGVNVDLVGVTTTTCEGGVCE